MRWYISSLIGALGLAESREKRKTFERKVSGSYYCVEMTEEDHADLSIMFQGANNIPEHV